MLTYKNIIILLLKEWEEYFAIERMRGLFEVVFNILNI
jgi:hypothetical protein